MGLYGVLNSGVSGMAAQSNKLTAISQNISNSDTTGYKDVEAQFEDVVSSASSSSFNGAGVTTNYAYLNSEQGGYTSTNTNTNLAISGNGFFIVENSAGEKFLTRDGSFTPNAAGDLVNSSGYTLLGYPTGTTGDANSLDALVPVNVNGASSSQTPTTSGTFSANVPATADAVTGDTPSTNASDATYTDKTSLTTYDNLGSSVTLDVYYTKTGDNTWEMSVYNHADAATGGGFPYSSGALSTQTLTFDGTTGDLTSPASGSLSIDIPNGQTMNLNISGMTQLASAWNVTTADVNGSAPSSATGNVDIAGDGTVSAVYADGTEKPIYTIQLAGVQSPDNLIPVSGNVWALSSAAGSVTVSSPESSGLGTLKSSTLESSTTDLATELTKMIQAQSGYEANSKVFQTGSTLLEELVNLIK